MPLSEHEQRLLEQMERALYAEDPKFASALRGADPRQHHRRRAVLGVAGFVIGLVLLMTGVARPLIAISVAGFVLMLASVVFTLTSWRQIPGADSSPGAGQVPSEKPKGRRRGRVMDRIEERWRRRREQHGQ